MLDELLRLSECHLQLITDEDWDECERVTSCKEALYAQLQQESSALAVAGAAGILKRVEELETAARNLLAAKMAEISRMLADIGRLKVMLKGYSGGTAVKGHFLLKA